MKKATRDTVVLQLRVNRSVITQVESLARLWDVPVTGAVRLLILAGLEKAGEKSRSAE